MWPYIKPYWFRALLGVALAVPVGALDSVVALFLKPYTDDVLVAKKRHFRIVCAAAHYRLCIAAKHTQLQREISDHLGGQ